MKLLQSRKPCTRCQWPTCHEIQEITEEFEDSLTQALVPLHADDNYEDDGEVATSEAVKADETLAYLDRRQRKAEPAGITTTWPVCDKQHYDMHPICSNQEVVS